MDRPIYLDHNATTPLAPEVVEAMVAALRDLWGNPSSAHPYGAEAREAVDHARGQVAELLGCDPDEIVFTSGGTESNNAAIIGAAEALEDRGRHLVISAVEHAAVDEACRYLEGRGWNVDRVGVGTDGRVKLDDLRLVVKPDTTLISVMHAQNETGVIQPIGEIARVARDQGVLFHTDAVQTVGKIPVRTREFGVDLLSLAGHKFYGPKGIGALYLKHGTPFAGFIRGTGHEGGRRSGTLNVAGIVGLGEACALASREIDHRPAHLLELRDRLEGRLRKHFPDLVIHGSEAERLPNTLYAGFPGVNANALIGQLEGVATAAGAACHAGVSEPSRVLAAMDVPPELAVCTLRLTVGRANTLDEMDVAAERISEAASKL
jgi:cysteine desulfurase